ncbi:MAG TPA: hypothetical protein VGJ67_04405 [Actinomycetota bacterium]
MEPSTPIPPEIPAVPSAFDPIRSFARLGLGAAEIAAEKLGTNLRLWELRVQQVPELFAEPEPEEPPAGRVVVEREVVETEDMLLEEVDVHVERVPMARARNAEDFRLALIGAVFDSGRRISSIRPELPPLARGGLRVLTSALNLIGVPEAVRFAKGRLSPIRGMTQERFDELVRVGRMEERHSRLLAEVALEDVSDSSIGEMVHRVSTSEEVRGVIRAESAGATEEVIDDVRDRAATADDRVEQRTRSVLRRSPRAPETPTTDEGSTPPEGSEPSE